MRPFAVLLAAAVVAGSAAPSAAADPRDPFVRCDQWRMSGVLAFAGVAHVESADVPESLTIACTYLNQTGRYTSTNGGRGAVVAVAGGGPLGAGPMTVCGEAVATYADGYVGRGTFGAC